MNPLDNLQDIHTPAPIGMWPPAYGWWLLALIILVLAVVLVVIVVKAINVRKAKRAALAELEQINENHPASHAKLNSLLKRAAMAYFQANTVASLHSQQWLDFLMQTYPKKDSQEFAKNMAEFQQSLYSKTIDNKDAPSSHKETVSLWLNHALPPTKAMLKNMESHHV